MKKLLKQYSRVWFYIPEECRAAFAEELRSMHIPMMDGRELRTGDVGLLMGVSDRAGYLSNLVWYCSFEKSDSPIKVHYGRYRAGEEDCVIKKPNILPVDLSKLVSEERRAEG